MRKPYAIVLYTVLILLALLFIFPFLMVLINSIKPIGDIVMHPMNLPETIRLSNYTEAWRTLQFHKLILHTFIVTFFSICGIIVFSCMMAYWSSRHESLYSRILVAVIITSMLLPFASIMIPLVQVLGFFKLTNSFLGAIISYWGIGLAFSYFIFRGAVSQFPIELEEAALIDGYSPIAVFFKIVLPLLTPTVFSVFIMDVFWIWNDFIIPLIVLNNPRLNTIQLGINSLFSMYNSKWDLGLAALMSSVLPIAVLFIFVQKYIISNVMAGSVKG